MPSVLPPEARAQIQRTHVRSFIPQSEVNFQFMQSSYGAGLGLVGAIVDLSVASAMAGGAENRAQQLREVIRDYEFRPHYWAAISNAVAESAWLDLRQLDPLPTGVMPVETASLAVGSAMNIGTDYFISPDTRVFEVITGIGVVVPNKPRKVAAAVTTTYHSAEIGREEGDKALALWMADGGAAYRRAATEGIQESAKLVRYALEFMGGSTSVSSRPAKIRARLLHARGGFGIPVSRITLKGEILEDTADRVIFRDQAGSIYSFPRNEVVVNYR